MIMLFTPEPGEKAPGEPAPRGFRIWGAIAKALPLILLAAGVLVLVELGWYVAGRIASPWNGALVRAESGAQPAKFAGSLNLATYNICHLQGSDANPWPIRDKAAMAKRRDEIVDILRRQSPDIVVLEEIDFDSVQTGRINQAEEIGRLAGYPYRVEHRDVDAATLFLFSSLLPET